MDLLQVKSIGKRDERGFQLQNIHLTQRAGQNIAIAGETGSGKTTLLKIIAGLAQPDEGEVIFLDEKVIGPADKLIPGHKGIVYLSQDFRLPHFLRVEQILEYANEWSPEKAEQLFTLCRIRHLFKRRTDELSGGEQQRIAIARLLVMDPRLFLLDEPFSNMDPANKRLLKTIIEDLSKKLNMSFIMTSHDPGDTLPWAHNVIIMKDGELIENKSPDEIYSKPAFAYTASLFGTYNIIPHSLLYVNDNEVGSGRENMLAIARPENCRIIAFTHAPQLTVNAQTKDMLVSADYRGDITEFYNAGNLDNLNPSPAGKIDNKDSYLSLPGKVMAIRYFGHYYETEVKSDDLVFTCRATGISHKKDDQVIIRIATSDVHLVKS